METTIMGFNTPAPSPAGAQAAGAGRRATAVRSTSALLLEHGSSELGVHEDIMKALGLM